MRFAILILMLFPYALGAQNYNSVNPDSLNKKRTLAVGVTEGFLVTGSYFGLYQLWYKDYSTGQFHFFNDNDEWLQMDKIGHTQSCYSIGRISTSMLNWCGVKRNKALWIGGLTGVAYMTGIEIMDGYSDGWGFSSGDMIANIGGSALYISQEIIWKEQRIVPKFGFRRSGYAHYRPELLGNGYQEEFLKDYNGQTYWLSFNIASFFKEESRFPKWLNVAFGYGANGMTGGSSNPVLYNQQGNEISFERYRQYYFSFDIDLSKLPVKNRFLKAVFEMVHFIKIPAPGIQADKNGLRPLLFAF
ncbi:MAG: YfiM family protein [Bacteroidia bacterium]|nr:YfiM family protein [Bacteroidia bacterium]